MKLKLMMCSLPLTGDTLFQMAEVHRQIQVQLEDVVRLEEPHIPREPELYFSSCRI